MSYFEYLRSVDPSYKDYSDEDISSAVREIKPDYADYEPDEIKQALSSFSDDQSSQFHNSMGGEPKTEEEPEGVGLADYGNTLMMGAAQIPAAVGWLAKKVPGPLGFSMDEAGNAVEKYGQGKVEEYYSKLSPAAKEEMAKEFITETDDGYGLGNASWHTAGLAGAGSVAATAVGMGVGGLATKGLLAAAPGRSALLAAGRGGAASNVATRAGMAGGVGTGPVASKVAAEAAKKLAKQEMLYGAGGFGLGEGTVGGVMTAQQVEREVLQMPAETIVKVPAFQEAYHSPELAELSHEDRFHAAQAKMAELASSDAGWKAGVTTSILGAPMGAAFGRGLFGNMNLGKTRLRAAGTGAAGEAAQEGPQSGLEELFSNLAIQEHGDPSRKPTEGVGNAVVGGMAAGGLMGGVVGGVGGYSPDNADPNYDRGPGISVPEAQTETTEGRRVLGSPEGGAGPTVPFGPGDEGAGLAETPERFGPEQTSQHIMELLDNAKMMGVPEIAIRNALDAPTLTDQREELRSLVLSGKPRAQLAADSEIKRRRAELGRMEELRKSSGLVGEVAEDELLGLGEASESEYQDALTASQKGKKLPVGEIQEVEDITAAPSPDQRELAAFDKAYGKRKTLPKAKVETIEDIFAEGLPGDTQEDSQAVAADEQAEKAPRRTLKTGVAGAEGQGLGFGKGAATKGLVRPEKQAVAPKKGVIGGKLSPGQVVTTSTGRETTPFPKVDTTTEGRARNTLKRTNAWLKNNAIAEAKSRGDDFTQFEDITVKGATPADMDGAEQYLFGEVSEVPESIVKPLVSEKQPVAKKPSKASKGDDLLDYARQEAPNYTSQDKYHGRIKGYLIGAGKSGDFLKRRAEIDAVWDEVQGSRETVATSETSEPQATLPPTGEAEHIDDGKAEPATQEVVTEAIQEGARATPRDMQEMREYLLSDIDAALKKTETAETPSLGRKLTDAHKADKKSGIKLSAKAAKARQGKLDAEVAREISEIGHVTFDVPGDGKFKILNTKERLAAFRKQVVKSPGFREAQNKPAIPSRRDGPLGTTINQWSKSEDPDDVSNAAEMLRMQGKDAEAAKLDARAESLRGTKAAETSPVPEGIEIEDEYASPIKAAAPKAASEPNLKGKQVTYQGYKVDAQDAVDQIDAQIAKLESVMRCLSA